VDSSSFRFPSRVPSSRVGRRVLVFGANGFIGHHLVRRLLTNTDWRVIATDLDDRRVRDCRGHPQFEFHRGDVKHRAFTERLVRASDVVFPLAGIATPRSYIVEPLRVFELDFEDNLAIVRQCVRHKNRVIWPSTSEVYGMSGDAHFHPETSNLVMGPISKMRWIYAAGKQLMDRIVWAYGRDSGLDFTIFRPFNWIGPGQDDIHDRSGKARVITKFAGNILRGEPLKLVDGGTNRRSFTYIDDCTDALVRMVKNPRRIATGKIYNIGNPRNNHSVREVAELMLELAASYPFFRDKLARVRIVSVTSKKHYGEGYQDMMNRTPYIENTERELSWKPTVTLREAIGRTFSGYVDELRKSGR